MASSQQYPGWAYLIAGVAIGLFVSFLVYLHNLPKSDYDIAAKYKTDLPAPKFEFYDILPELEVVVPELLNPKNKSITDNSTAITPPKPNTQLNSGESFVLQVGSFKDHKQADKMKATLTLLGLEVYILQVTVDNKPWNRVYVGPYKTEKALAAAHKRLHDNKIEAIKRKISS